jgi:phosphoglycolate phosphatase-like HAD superfamily hydrolase
MPHPAMIGAALAETGAAPDLSMMIGVARGRHDPQELLAAGADYIAVQPSDGTTFVRALA